MKKRRMYVEDSSDSEAENASEDEAAESTEAQGGGMMERLVVGVLARRRVDNEGAGGDRRCQAGAAEARRGLRGGGTRGWVSWRGWLLRQMRYAGCPNRRSLGINYVY